jgi:hypothetical protein
MLRTKEASHVSKCVGVLSNMTILEIIVNISFVGRDTFLFLNSTTAVWPIVTHFGKRDKLYYGNVCLDTLILSYVRPRMLLSYDDGSSVALFWCIVYITSKFMIWRSACFSVKPRIYLFR